MPKSPPRETWHLYASEQVGPRHEGCIRILTEFEHRPSFFGVPGQERYLWHPEVHDLYRESCYYYLISGSYGRGRHVIDGLDRIFGDLEIVPSTANIVYGPYDVLVRLWLTREKRRKFKERMRSISRNEIQIENLLEFEAQEITYIHSRDLADWSYRAAPGSMQNEIRAVAQASAANKWTPEANTALAELREADLVRSIQTPPDAYKLFMFLLPKNPATVISDRVSRDLLPLVLKVNPGLSHVSLYRGAGFCSFIFKGITKSYYSTLGIVEDIQERLDGLGLTAWSLVAADYGERLEGDPLESGTLMISDALEPLVRAVADKEGMRRRLGELSQVQQAALAQVLAKASAILALSRELDRFTELLAAVLSEDRRSVNQTLSFLTSIEGDIREALPRLINASRLLGPESLSQIAQNHLRPKERRPETELISVSGGAFATADLSELFSALRDVVRQDPEVGSIAEKFLPIAWENQSRSLVELRNHYTHSRLTENLIGMNFEKLGLVMDELMFAIKFQIGIEELATRTSGIRTLEEIDAP
jgi:hypothetical protein